MTTTVLIPALNEEASIGLVLADLPPVREVVVIDNGSTDNTTAVARDAGATVLAEPQRGYGRACLTGVEHVRAQAAAGDAPDVVAFVDADYSDHPDELPHLLALIERGEADLVIGSRILGQRRGWVEPGALLPQARVGNRLACALMRWRWDAAFTDLGPFRAIRWPALRDLGMADEDFGWTVEMQVRALRAGLRCTEVPVHYRRRVGVSKITGTVTGSVRAGLKILGTIGGHAFSARAR